MRMELAARVAVLTKVINANWLVNYMAVCCAALLTVDYLHTLPGEVKHMWRASLSPVKVLFLIVRYYSFVHTAFTVNYFHHGTLAWNGDDCQVPFKICAYSSLILLWFCSAVAFMRVYAFSGRRKSLGYFLIVFFLALRCFDLALMYKFTNSVTYMEFGMPTRFGCVTTGGFADLFMLAFVSTLVGLVVGTAIMIYIAWRRRQNLETQNCSSLANIFVDDGIMYFIVLSLLSMISITFDRSAPIDGTQYAMLEFYVHADAIITGRMLIHLRESAEKDAGLTEAGKMSGRLPWSTAKDTGNSRYAPNNRSFISENDSQ